MSMSTCCLHLDANSDIPESHFSDKSWKTFLKCVTTWSILDGREKEIADTHLHYIDKPCDPDLVFHKQCYSRFTDKTKIERAQKRCLYSSNQPSQPKRLRSNYDRVSFFICRTSTNRSSGVIQTARHCLLFI
jgi:hypothetical protein